ncbi:velvet factor-domain-containing protein [Favolaschia claudopus]|uniref:Velvet factor-domain-containing protein n=1 Tax=Favolaschia claudopus TaxID=2862362 RepID=A0AAW0AA60_9AGAR
MAVWVGPQPNPATLRHELIVRQMPVEARASMRGRPDRRPLDPVPVVELRLFQRCSAAGFDQRIDVPLYKLTDYALCVELIDDESDEKVEYLGDKTTKVLSGYSVSSVYPAPDPEESERLGLFFTFPHLGVRRTGVFKLRFTLSLLNPNECRSPIAIYSSAFRVVNAANYGGVRNSTPLTLALANRGARPRIRKKARGANPRQLRRLSLSVRSLSRSCDSSATPDVSRKEASETPAPVDAAPLLLVLHAPQPRYPPASRRVHFVHSVVPLDSDMSDGHAPAMAVSNLHLNNYLAEWFST